MEVVLGMGGEYAVPLLSFRKAYEILRQRLVYLGKDTFEAEAEARFFLRWLYGLDALTFLKALRSSEPSVPQAIVEAFLRARERGIPFAYLVGEAEFLGLRLRVTPDVLVPRGDSERLVEAVLDLTQKEHSENWRILDLGTGSGALGLAVLAQRPHWTGDLVDLSCEALAIAAYNARLSGLAERVRLILGDVFTSSASLDTLAPVYDGIVANPPYVTSKEISTLAPEVHWEPFIALDGGPDGLYAYPRVAALAEERLRSGGFLAVEVGGDLDKIVRIREIFFRASLDLSREIFDYGGQLRGFLWKKR